MKQQSNTTSFVVIALLVLSHAALVTSIALAQNVIPGQTPVKVPSDKEGLLQTFIAKNNIKKISTIAYGYSVDGTFPDGNGYNFHISAGYNNNGQKLVRKPTLDTIAVYVNLKNNPGQYAAKRYFRTQTNYVSIKYPSLSKTDIEVIPRNSGPSHCYVTEILKGDELLTPIHWQPTQCQLRQNPNEKAQIEQAFKILDNVGATILEIGNPNGIKDWNDPKSAAYIAKVTKWAVEASNYVNDAPKSVAIENNQQSVPVSPHKTVRGSGFSFPPFARGIDPKTGQPFF
jgi:hypothetical protein